MDAATLLRSVATHHRPFLARGFHSGARSGPGGSLPPPTSNKQEGGDRFMVAGFRQNSGHGKQPDGATEKGAGIYTLEEDFAKVYRGIMELGAGIMEIGAGIKEFQAGIKDFQAGMKDTEAGITELKISLESAGSKGKGIV